MLKERRVKFGVSPHRKTLICDPIRGRFDPERYPELFAHDVPRLPWRSSLLMSIDTNQRRRRQEDFISAASGFAIPSSPSLQHFSSLATHGMEMLDIYILLEAYILWCFADLWTISFSTRKIPIFLGAGKPLPVSFTDSPRIPATTVKDKRGSSWSLMRCKILNL
ncbi:hypothetical protein ONS96_014952 [Cadophora gregata f. sp. sojae]|nr:hypothetical protein ONS96_014952 [Cadophora gregata f. sp. sojae]